MNKSSKETRMERADNRSSFKLDSVYYKVIAALLIILAVLVVYIIWQGGSSKNKNIQSKAPVQEEVVQNENAEDDNSSSKEDHSTDAPAADEDTANNTKEVLITEGVDPNAPLDKSHEISYEEGSSDMNAVLKLSKQVTGLGDDMYPVWIGNNGPGKVQATVSSQDNSKQFVVDLQFGDGSWHVTHVEQISE